VTHEKKPLSFSFPPSFLAVQEEGPFWGSFVF